MNAGSSAVAERLRKTGRRGLGGEVSRWVKGVVISLAILGTFVFAAARSISTRPALNELCLKQMAEEEHTTLEAFFQNPAAQDALVQAITACSR